MIRNRLAAPLARLHESVGRWRDFERLEVRQASALTVICDDGECADLDVVDVLTAADVRGVFAVSPDLVGRPGFIGYPQLAQLRDAGHEIAFHGTTHEPFTRFRRQVDLSAAVCDGMKRLADEGFFPTTLVYPYGANNHRVRTWVAPLFDCAFTTWHGANVRATTLAVGRTTNRRTDAASSVPRRLHAGRRGCCTPGRPVTRESTTPCWRGCLPMHAQSVYRSAPRESISPTPRCRPATPSRRLRSDLRWPA